MSVVESVISGVRSVIVPLSVQRLLLPNASVAEVVDYVQLDSLPDAPEWLLGQLEWRQRLIPVVSFSRLLHDPEEEGHRLRIAVCNTLGADPGLPFIGLKSSAIPHLVRATQSNIAAASAPVDAVNNPAVLRAVRIGEEDALIPNLGELEVMVKQAWSPPAG
jgi:chemosensory pili system protein ChpC